jgi:hypothetical protein
MMPAWNPELLSPKDIVEAITQRAGKAMVVGNKLRDRVEGEGSFSSYSSADERLAAQPD